MQDMRKPILPGTAKTDYERYIRTEELLALQKTPAEMSHPDELTFQVVHQASELMMKGAAWELERAVAAIEAGDFANAGRLIRRAMMELQPPLTLLPVLETITPYDYHVIRAGLGHGSGLDSPGFLALLHVGPRLGAAFHTKLSEAGLTINEMYRQHAQHFGLHEIAEALLDFDELVQHFRFRHLKLAQRIIGGGVVGTMGTPVEVLHQRQQHLFYKDLWEVRNQITAWANEQNAANPVDADRGPH